MPNPPPKKFEGFPYGWILASPAAGAGAQLLKRLVSVDRPPRTRSSIKIETRQFARSSRGLLIACLEVFQRSRLELSLNGPKCIPRQIGKH